LLSGYLSTQQLFCPVGSVTVMSIVKWVLDYSILYRTYTI